MRVFAEGPCDTHRMAAPYPGPYGPPPQVDPRELRPSRAWFWVGGVLIPLSIVLGVVLFVVLLFRGLALPEFSARTQGAQSTTFTVDSREHPEPGWLLYGSPKNVDHTACALISPDEQILTFSYPTFNHEWEGSEGAWAMVGMADLTEPGEYTLTCQAPDGVRFGIAYGGDTTGNMMTGLLGALGSLLIIPFLGVVGGVVLIIVTAVRRGRHRQQLLNERSAQGPPPGQYPGQYSGPYPGSPPGYQPPPPGGYPGPPPHPPQGGPPPGPQGHPPQDPGPQQP